MAIFESFSVLGVCILAALDSAPFFALPFGIDAAIVIVSSRHPQTFWLIAILASFASLPGAALTFYVGRRAGELGLRRFMSRKRLESIERGLRTKGTVALALLDLIPPPFPFKACLLAAGGLHANTRTFFLALLAGRLIRFGFEAWLGVTYGPHVFEMMKSNKTTVAVWLLVGVGVVVVGYLLYPRRRDL